jgi:predicted nucleic acid-binding protein
MSETIAIVDASLVIKAILPNPEMPQCRLVLERLKDTQLVAPALWIYEITSALTKAVHFEQLTEPEGREVLHQALTLGVQIVLPDEVQSRLAYDWTNQLQRTSAYDSFYLITAEALNADFWTADHRLERSLGDHKPTWLHWAGELA